MGGLGGRGVFWMMIARVLKIITNCFRNIFKILPMKYKGFRGLILIQTARNLAAKCLSAGLVVKLPRIGFGQSARIRQQPCSITALVVAIVAPDQSSLAAANRLFPFPPKRPAKAISDHSFDEV